MKKNDFNKNSDHCSESCECKNNSVRNCKNHDKKECCNEKLDKTSLIEEIKKLKDDLLRSFADMENLKKRTEIDIKNNKDYITSSIVKSFVVVADNLNLALDTYNKNKNDISCLIDGIKMINTEFMRILNGFGVEQIKTLGELFNPELHQAISMKVPDKEEDINKIAEVIQVGYTLNGKVIKPSLVVVYKK